MLKPISGKSSIFLAATIGIGALSTLAFAILFLLPPIRAPLLSPTRLSFISAAGFSLITTVVCGILFKKEQNKAKKQDEINQVQRFLQSTDEKKDPALIRLACRWISDDPKNYLEFVKKTPTAPVQLYKLFANTEHTFTYTFKNCLSLLDKATMERGLIAFIDYVQSLKNPSHFLLDMVDYYIKSSSTLALQTIGRISHERALVASTYPLYDILITKLVLSSLSNEFVINLLKNLRKECKEIPKQLHYSVVLSKNGKDHVYSNNPSIAHLCIDKPQRAEALDFF